MRDCDVMREKACWKRVIDRGKKGKDLGKKGEEIITFLLLKMIRYAMIYPEHIS